MSLPMRRTSSRSEASKRSISSARERRTGSPYLRTSRSAASRRARVSGSSFSCGSATCPCASVCTSSDIARILNGDSLPLSRIDVDGEVDVFEGAVAGRGLDGGAGGGDRLGPGGGLQDELEALAVAEAEERCRTEQLGAGRVDLLRESRGGGVGGPGVLQRARDDADQVGERRIGPGAA